MSLRRIVWSLLILAVLFFVGRLALSGTPGPSVEDGSALVVEIGGAYAEAQSAPLVAMLLGEPERPFLSVLSILRLAELDDRIDTVVLRIRGLEIGWGKAQELRAALSAVRAAGRKVVAVLELEGVGAHREYYVASAAERVLLHPGGHVPLVGLSAEYIHLGALLAEVGVGFDVGQAGRFKSAVELFTNEEMSPEAREMTNSLLDSLDAQLIAGIAKSRGIEEARVRAAIDAGVSSLGELQSYGLADGEGTVAELVASFDSVVYGEDYAGIDPADVGFEEEARFALIYAAGSVVTGEGSRTQGGDPVMSSDTVSEAIAEAAESEEISALVLRVDSPGGSALASEMIWQAVREARESSAKPIVVSFSDVAASGGYYVSAGADAIVSNPGTLTGSIGVFVLKPHIGGLLERLKVGVEPFMRGPRSDLGMAGRPLSAQSRERLQASALDVYAKFLERVAQGRGLEVAAVDAVGQGRVWTGEQAMQAGLVDRLGGLRSAVELAKEKAGLDPDASVLLSIYPEPPTIAEQLSEIMGVSAAARSALPLPAAARRVARGLANLASMPSGAPLAILPFELDIR